jgi:cytoskeleton protein RodZ
MVALGERLRLAREQAGLSIDDMSARTKIQLAILEAIERDEFERVPGGLFVRGFLRAYAREVGLEPEAIVADYLDQYEPELVVPAEPVRRETDVPADVILAHQDLQGFSWRKVWPAAAVATVVLGIFITAGSSPPTTPVPAAEAGLVGTTGRIERAPEPAPVPQQPNPADPLTLDLRAKRDVWVAATADGERVVYRILKAGEQTKVTARQEINARVGDAEAFEYSVNGVSGQPLGAPGEVRDIQMTRGSFRSVRVERPAPAQVPKSSGTWEPGNP